jgi:hypothetical protein
MICVGFVAWKFLGNSVSGSTKKAETKFNKGGETAGQQGAAGGTAAGGTAAGGDDKGKQAAGKPAAAGGGGQDPAKVGTPGGAGVATVQKPGTGTPVQDHGDARVVTAETTAHKPRSFLKWVAIALLVVGLMAAVYTFGKKKSTA